MYLKIIPSLFFCGTNITFPVCCRWRLPAQVEYKLNMSCKSRSGPTKFTFEMLRNKHDYNANLFAPLGCAMEMHVIPSKAKFQEEYTKIGFHILNLLGWYSWHWVWIKRIKSTRVQQTFFFKQKLPNKPIIPPNDVLLQATPYLYKF